VSILFFLPNILNLSIMESATLELYVWLGASIALNFILFFKVICMWGEKLIKKSDKEMEMIDGLIRLSENIESLQKPSLHPSQNQPKT